MKYFSPRLHVCFPKTKLPFSHCFFADTPADYQPPGFEVCLVFSGFQSIDNTEFFPDFKFIKFLKHVLCLYLLTAES